MAEISQSGGSNHSGGKVRSKKTSTRIDMTPMVDLAFLLLTFFMLTTVLTDPYILKIEMPDKSDTSTPPPIQEKRVITIILGEKDKIYWYHGVKDPKIEVTNFSATGIRKILLEKNSQIKNMYVFIKPSEKSRYKNVVDILDEMLITEIARYSLLKITPEDKQLIASFNKK